MNSIISWIGGKKLLRKQIEELIPEKPKRYVEPFGGAGWVLFYKDRWAPEEIYNDKDSRLVNLFKIAKYHPEALEKEMLLLPASREIFKELRNSNGLTDIQRAARFFYVLKRSFAAKGESFAGSRAISQENILRSIMDISKRLDKVVIENLDYKEILKRYDKPTTFFYCDPPYRIGEQYQVGVMDYEELLLQLSKIKGKFLLSLDDDSKGLNRKVFKNFEIIELSRLNSINRKHIKNNLYKELLIKNY